MSIGVNRGDVRCYFHWFIHHRCLEQFPFCGNVSRPFLFTELYKFPLAKCTNLFTKVGF